ncbi:MAG TPA: Coq4 family protein [Alphaproteobacteria bacterium]|jgi:ubiquinone biosynthesis protein COQ4|nr:Coq4 family protein [Alphaproteobacteria bacterium]
MMQATATIGAADFAEKSPVPSRPVQWRRAGKAFRALVLQQGDVLDATYSVVDAMGGMCEERLFQRFRKTPEGQRLLAERSDLPRLLTDHQTLAQLPEGTLGRIFADVCIGAGINSMALVEAQRNMSRDYVRLDPARQWFSDRLTVLHDLWHILSGYATQPRGEAGIVAFSYAQGLDYRPIPFFMALSVVMRVARVSEVWQAYRRGRQTAALVLQRYEELLPLPLETVRKRLNIPDGRAWHGPGAGEGLLA